MFTKSFHDSCLIGNLIINYTKNLLLITNTIGGSIHFIRIKYTIVIAKLSFSMKVRLQNCCNKNESKFLLNSY